MRNRRTVRGRLYLTPLAARHRLDYARELLHWTYMRPRSTQDLQKTYWEWFCGVTAEGMQKKIPHGWKRLLRDTADWDWPDLQRQVREKLDTMFSPKPIADRRRWITTPRVLGSQMGPDGKPYFHYGGPRQCVPKPTNFADVTADEFAGELNGIHTEVLGRCEVCHNFFVRLRPTRAKYCSSSCRGLASLQRFGYVPPQRRRHAIEKANR